MVCQNVWNAADMGLTGKFIEKKITKNQIFKLPIKTLEKNNCKLKIKWKIK